MNLTSALVNGSPFENVTPRRSANSHTVGAIRFHESGELRHERGAVGRAARERVEELRLDVGIRA